MDINDLHIDIGENDFQTAKIEANDKILDYETSRNLSYTEVISTVKGLDVISEFFDVNAAAAVSGANICAVSLGKSIEDGLKNLVDINPEDFMNAALSVSGEVNGGAVKLLRSANIIAAPAFTKDAIDFLEKNNIGYITVKTPLGDYRKFLSDTVKITPMGTLTQSPNYSDLNKNTFKVVSAAKPSMEQAEDAVFAWKIAKHAVSQAIVIAKDLKTSAISQGLHSSIVETALNYSCDRTKDAVLASDLPLSAHDIKSCTQARIALIILPAASEEVIKTADRYNISVITTGFTNRLY